MSESSDPTPPAIDLRRASLGELTSQCLQQPEALGCAAGDRVLWRLLLLIVPSMAAVGFLMATFSGGPQLLITPLKLMLGTLAAMALCLPSLFVLSNLGGVAIGLRQACGSMLLAVSVLALVLLALAPVGLVFSLSTPSSKLVGSIHIGFLITAAAFAASALKRVWGGSERRSAAAGVWMTLFVVVLLQLSTSFRPLIGAWEPVDLSHKKVFLQHWLTPEGERANDPASG